jgi:hypothetical protein
MPLSTRPVGRIFVLPFILSIALSLIGVGTISFAASKLGDDSVDRLLSDGDLNAVFKLQPDEKARMAKQLVAARHGAFAQQNQRIDYLLASLGREYERNRDDLLFHFQGCTHAKPDRDCDDMTGEYLMELYLHGHREVLRPLCAAFPIENVTLSEGLGSFLGDRLPHNTREFAAVLLPSIPNRSDVFARWWRLQTVGVCHRRTFQKLSEV